jgi:quercetin dioxygenase-like cupin family protein
MTLEEMEKNIVRYADLKPCKTAFIDAHTPGSSQKDNFTIIGAGVSESPDQHVHINQTPGFNIGAAGQPPGCTNSLHSHTTAEVFYVLKGRWRFFWGRYGDAGELVAEEGDMVNIPTGIFRAFENVGDDYGMLMAILGGNDAGGGVTWTPEVIHDAKNFGLILGENGLLYDTKRGESLPKNVNPMPILSEAKLKNFPEISTEEFINNFFVSSSELNRQSQNSPLKVIGEDGILKDRPGFEVEYITTDTFIDEPYIASRYEVNMIMSGVWSLEWNGNSTSLSPGDTCLIQPDLSHKIVPAESGNASLFRVTNTDDTAGPTRRR